MMLAANECEPWDNLHQSKGDLKDVPLSRKVQKPAYYAAPPLCAVLKERLLLLAVITHTRHYAHFSKCGGESLETEKIRAS